MNNITTIYGLLYLNFNYCHVNLSHAHAARATLKMFLTRIGSVVSLMLDPPVFDLADLSPGHWIKKLRSSLAHDTAGSPGTCPG